MSVEEKRYRGALHGTATPRPEPVCETTLCDVEHAGEKHGHRMRVAERDGEVYVEVSEPRKCDCVYTIALSELCHLLINLREGEQWSISCRPVDGAGHVHDNATPRPEPVCATCKDTHWMTLGERGEVPCTRCPTPCQRCRAGGSGPYCATTPCACGCHGARTEPVGNPLPMFVDGDGRALALAEEHQHTPMTEIERVRWELGWDSAMTVARTALAAEKQAHAEIDRAYDELVEMIGKMGETEDRLKADLRRMTKERDHAVAVARLYAEQVDDRDRQLWDLREAALRVTEERDAERAGSAALEEALTEIAESCEEWPSDPRLMPRCKWCGAVSRTDDGTQIRHHDGCAAAIARAALTPPTSEEGER